LSYRRLSKGACDSHDSYLVTEHMSYDTRRKPTIFGRAFTDSIHISVVSP
jgi:hypothetical protein